ncbi:MAG: ATP-grasp domain-containing protein [Burkholderiales bacterium]
MKTLVVLFPNERDKLELESPRFQSQFRIHFEGFDLHRFPDNAKLVTFNVHRYIDRLVRRCEKLKPDAVFSTDEQFGALIAAIVARRLGLPGTDPQAILNTQHKWLARQIQQRVVPDATPAFAHFSYEIERPEQTGLAFPFFVKPIKATWSVLARRVDNFAELRQHLNFHPLEKFIIKRLVKPFNDILHENGVNDVDAHHLIAEELIDGHLVTLEGYAKGGQIHHLGITDSVLFPQSYAFKRFEYPSRLPPSVQKRMQDIATTVMQASGFDFGLFNMELYYREPFDDIKIVEINPRLARQFCDMHEKVDGRNTFDILLALNLDQPLPEKTPPQYGCAASFVFRDFSGKGLPAGPTDDELNWLKRTYPDARLLVYPKQGASLAREIKWLGSYRYAVLNLGGTDWEDLMRRHDDIAKHLTFRLT